MRTRVLAVLAAGVMLVVLGGLLWTPSRPPSGMPAAARIAAPPDRVATAISTEQDRLRRLPGDWRAWARLGMAYLEQARITADAAYQAKAEGAFGKSLAVRPDDNADAVAGLGALANVRHDFATALRYGRDAQRLSPDSPAAYAVLADALTQLGQDTAATEAVQRMLDLRPGVASHSRASYDLELHGRTAEAADLLRRALDTTADPGDQEFCRYQLGELAWHAGDLAEAGRQYALAPGHPHGLAKIRASRGDLGGYTDLVARQPLPQYLIEYAELLRAAGKDASPVLAAATVAAGTDDLAAAQLAIAADRPADAVTHARAEWARRHHVDVADTLAWALHLAGHSAEALPYAREAARLGTRSAPFAYHLGMIELATGDRSAARTDLGRALAINPTFSPRARAALAGLES